MPLAFLFCNILSDSALALSILSVVRADAASAEHHLRRPGHASSHREVAEQRGGEGGAAFTCADDGRDIPCPGADRNAICVSYRVV